MKNLFLLLAAVFTLGVLNVQAEEGCGGCKGKDKGKPTEERV